MKGDVTWFKLLQNGLIIILKLKAKLICGVTTLFRVKAHWTLCNYKSLSDSKRSMRRMNWQKAIEAPSLSSWLASISLVRALIWISRAGRRTRPIAVPSLVFWRSFSWRCSVRSRCSSSRTTSSRISSSILCSKICTTTTRSLSMHRRTNLNSLCPSSPSGPTCLSSTTRASAKSICGVWIWTRI